MSAIGKSAVFTIIGLNAPQNPMIFCLDTHPQRIMRVLLGNKDFDLMKDSFKHNNIMNFMMLDYRVFWDFLAPPAHAVI